MMMESSDKSPYTSHPDYRAFQRHFVKSSIQIKGYRQEEIFPATIDNYCRGGIHVVAPAFLETGRLIMVQAIRDELPGIEPTHDMGAKVAWCRKDIGREKSGFPDYYELGVRWLPLTCDWRNRPVSFEDFYQTKELVILCPSCRNDFEAIEKGHLGKSVYRQLIGNVV